MRIEHLTAGVIGRPCLQVLALLALLALSASGVAQKAELQQKLEQYPSGALKEKFQVNARGQRVGAFVAYYENGTVRLRTRYQKNLLHGSYATYRLDGSRAMLATYRKGKLHGSYKNFDETGRPRLITQFVNGQRHGKAKVYAGQDIVSTQKWKHGELIELDGIRPYPYSLAQIRAAFAAIKKLEPVKPRHIRKPPRFKPPDDDPHATERLAALHKLQEYRFLCRVPYAKMWLDPEYLVYCDAAAEVFRMNGDISHTPEKPAGCDSQLYARALIGAKSSNISGGSNLVRSVDSYMEDSDDRNLSRGVGHRQYCLNPRMVITGFGKSSGGSAMWAHDTTGLRLPKQLTIRYPPAGYMPVTHFGPTHAWSINLHPWKFGVPRAGNIKVRVFEMDEDCVKAQTPLEMNFFKTFDGPNEFTPCVVFRPVGVRVLHGQRYWVELDVKKQRKWLLIRYVVHFVDLEKKD